MSDQPGGVHFDVIVTVDWSASSTPRLGADSLWMYWLDVASGNADLCNIARREQLRDLLVHRLADLPADVRALVAVDVSFGYPHGFAAAAGLPGEVPAWRAAWAHLAAAGDDRWSTAADLNRRLGVAHFWGVPAARASAHLSPTKPKPALGMAASTASSLAEFRVVEQRLRAKGLRPFSSWQLLGAGAVGGQMLTALPVLHHVRHHPSLVDRARVWPFETGASAPSSASIVLAEAWPSALPSDLVDSIDHPVKDARQVTALAEHLAELQRAGSLGAWFTPTLSDDERRVVVSEEGWILGVG